MRNFTAATLTLAALLGSSPAWAGTTNDTTLASPGVYFGNTTENDHYTVDTERDVEIGLTAVKRFLGNYTPTGSTYDVMTGATTAAGHTGTDWGVSFSVHLLGGVTTNDITTVFSFTDVNLGTTHTLDILGINDNAEFDGTNTCADISQPGCTLGPNIIGVQNSESLSFPSIIAALDPGFDINANDTYLVSLQVLSGTNSLGKASITINAGTGSSVPEPITLSLFGAGLAGAVAMRRRKKAKA